MQQLETKFYSRAEIAEELKLNINDNKHFKRNLDNKLVKWGYSYEYDRKGVLITRAPENADEKLAEILIREYDLDVQIDTYSFACFITAFEDVEKFDSMPWGERENILKEFYDVDVTDRTLKNWASKLFKTGTLSKSNEKTYWSTSINCFGQKTRQWIIEDSEEYEEMSKYFERRKELVKQFMSEGKNRSEAWTEANKTLWCEYGCCYYGCKTVMPGAFDQTRHLHEIYEYVREIAASGEEAVFKVETAIVRKPTNVTTGEFNF
jgi:hypothetical protein